MSSRDRQDSELRSRLKNQNQNQVEPGVSTYGTMHVYINCIYAPHLPASSCPLVKTRACSEITEMHDAPGHPKTTATRSKRGRLAACTHAHGLARAGSTHSRSNPRSHASSPRPITNLDPLLYLCLNMYTQNVLALSAPLCMSDHCMCICMYASVKRRIRTRACFKLPTG